MILWRGLYSTRSGKADVSAGTFQRFGTWEVKMKSSHLAAVVSLIGGLRVGPFRALWVGLRTAALLAAQAVPCGGTSEEKVGQWGAGIAKRHPRVRGQGPKLTTCTDVVAPAKYKLQELGSVSVSFRCLYCYYHGCCFSGHYVLSLIINNSSYGVPPSSDVEALPAACPAPAACCIWRQTQGR